jgi:hypothetical protein
MTFQIAPALVGTPLNGRYPHELVRTDDIDPAVCAILQSEDPIPTHEAMLHDPVQISADEIVAAPGSHPSRDPKLSTGGARGDSCRERLGIAAGKGHFRQVQSRHAS